VLAQFTDQGLHDVPNMVERVRRNQAGAAAAGVKVTGYVTMGEYDEVIIIEASDEQALAGVLSLATQGNLRTKTLRAFTVDELESALKLLPSDPVTVTAV
jgi:uncharacterized protein with GYD domain